MTLSSTDQMLIEQRITNEAPNVAVAYLLWFFLGWVSGHRFYLGHWKTALLQILLFFVAIGFVWLFIDLFLIPGMVRDIRERMRTDLSDRLRAGQLPA
jgi:TM2 domain-containing membrane protein YozV